MVNLDLFLFFQGLFNLDANHFTVTYSVEFVLLTKILLLVVVKQCTYGISWMKLTARINFLRFEQEKLHQVVKKVRLLYNLISNCPGERMVDNAKLLELLASVSLPPAKFPMQCSQIYRALLVLELSKNEQKVKKKNEITQKRRNIQNRMLRQVAATHEYR